MRAVLGWAFLLAALRFGPLPVEAQSVAVVVVTGSAGRPIAGALVSLRDGSNRVIKQVLADQNGRATVAAPAAGRFRLKVDGIGYQGQVIDSLEVPAGAPVRIRVALTERPLDLGEVVVTSRRKAECRLDPDEGTFVARVWAEARKALVATQLTAQHRPILDVMTYERDLDAAERIHTERADSARAASARPFVSIDPEVLHRDGYVFERPDGIWFNAPDADLLLSERFLEDHCFGVTGASPTSPPGVVGLSFEPTRSRQVPEVGGVLWLDQKSAELRRLDFGYRNVQYAAEAHGVGGWLEFHRLPDGGFIVSAWQIRMPRSGSMRLSGGENLPRRTRDSLAGYREAGGTARLAENQVADRRSISLTGTVIDSTTRSPLAGVRVSIQAGAFGDTTDASGRYRIAAPATGQYAVTFAHPMFEVAGLEAPIRGARLQRGVEDTVDLAVPLLTTALRAACVGVEIQPDHSVVIGQVLDSTTGAPVGGVTIALKTAVFRLVGRTVVSDRALEIETTTNARGYFNGCAPPAAKEVTVTARRPGRPPLAFRVPIPAGRLARVELKVP
jgi:hypothetical protein